MRLFYSIKITCLRRESNPHSHCGEQDFKSCVSTNSTTRACKKNPEPPMRDGTWSERPGSNRPPRPWQGRALPNELLSLLFLRSFPFFSDCKNRDEKFSTKFFLLFIFRGVLATFLNLYFWGTFITTTI